MARLILDTYPLSGTVSEGTDQKSSVGYWMLDKSPGCSSEECRQFSRPDVLLRGDRHGRIGDRASGRTPPVPEADDVPAGRTPVDDGGTVPRRRFHHRMGALSALHIRAGRGL